MHGLGVDVRTLRHDTAVMAYLLDPAEGKYLLEDLALRYPLARGALTRRRGGARSTSTASAGVEETGRRAAVVLRLADALAEALDARELTDLYERIERPLVRVLAKMERRRHPHRPRVPRRAERASSTRSATR